MNSSKRLRPVAERAISRRAMLGLAAVAPAALLAFRAQGAEQAAQMCVNLDTLPASQKSMRRSLNFKVTSADPKKKCQSCAFFTAAGACGKCQLFSGGAVYPASVCDSWSPRG